MALKHKNHKFLIASVIAATTVVGGLFTFLPSIYNFSNTKNIASKPLSSNTMQTGKIIHDENVQVVNSVNDILSDFSFGSNSYAIVRENNEEQIYVWGKNESGQLGVGKTSAYISEPTLFPKEKYFKSGDSSPIATYNINFGSDVNININYAIITRGNGAQELWTWGANDSGQLGLDNSTPIGFNTPRQVDNNFFDNAITAHKFKSFHSVYRGDKTTYVIVDIIYTATGIQSQALYSTGSNSHGQLGTSLAAGGGVKKFTYVPLSTTGIIAHEFSFSNNSVLFTLTKGSVRQVYGWGNNSSKQVNPTNASSSITAPVEVFSTLNDTSIVKTNQGSSFKWDKNATTKKVIVWGDNQYGQLGINSRTPPTTLNSYISQLDSITINSVEIGKTSHAIVRSSSNISTLYTWGYNNGGQVGNNSTTDRLLPSSVSLGTLSSSDRIIKAQTGVGLNSYALIEKNTVMELYLWGQNDFGQLGSAKLNTPNLIPTKITTLPSKSTIIDAFMIEQPATTDITNNGSSTIIVVNNNGKTEHYGCGSNVFGSLTFDALKYVQLPTKIIPMNSSNPIVNEFESTSTAIDALNSIQDRLQLNDKSVLSKYVDISSIPDEATLLVNESKFNNTLGTIDFVLQTNFIYKPFKNSPQRINKTFPINLSGFKKLISTNEDIIVVKTPDVLPDEFFNNAYYTSPDGTTLIADKSYISKFVDISCVPDDEQIEFERISYDANTIEFNLSVNYRYINGSKTKKPTTWHFLTQFDVVKSLEQLIYILIISGVSVLLLSGLIIFLCKARSRKLNNIK